MSSYRQVVCMPSLGRGILIEELYSLFEKKCNFNLPICPGALRVTDPDIDRVVKKSWGQWHCNGLDLLGPQLRSARSVKIRFSSRYPKEMQLQKKVAFLLEKSVQHQTQKIVPIILGIDEYES